MLVSTQNDQLMKRFGPKESVRILAQAGFEAYDMSLYYCNGEEDPLDIEDYREFAQDLREYADSLGIICNQSHAVFRREYDSKTRAALIRHMEIASILGAKIIVVHPYQHLYYHKNVQELKEINLQFYRSLLPYCEKFNIKIAIENMYRYYNDQQGNNLVGSVCARPEEFCEYVDMLDSPWIVACLDVGHVSIVGEDLTEMIHKLGPRLQALHIHDTDTEHDLHTLPFQGKIDWQEVTQSLADIDYKGDVTLEADAFYGSLPTTEKDAYIAAATYMCSIARTLRNMINEKKKG
ncbi:MAG: sugar phosphate isomerase/epimerase [Clostridia bacterium]|nr:sugar phosphate isomerase/epimerase [Clostridia bacterium]